MDIMSEGTAAVNEETMTNSPQKEEETLLPAAASVVIEEQNTPPCSSPFNLQRSLHIAAIFLSAIIIIDVTCTFFGDPTDIENGTVGPLKSIAEFIIPQLVARYPTTVPLFVSGEESIDGMMCPPGGFLDRGLSLLQKEGNEEEGIKYSVDYDPRDKKSAPSSFPHCELKKWVQLPATQTKRVLMQCPAGEEYITHIYPKGLKRKTKSRDVKIIHIATPTNCIPTSTVKSLQEFVQHYYDNPKPQITIAIYLHSQETIDAFLHRRVWNVFPEVKEGLLCGMAKVKFVVMKVLDDIMVKSTSDETEQQQRKELIANEIASLTQRDIWRYLVLWEFGGTVLDLEVVQSIATAPASSTFTESRSTLVYVARQWYAGEWFGKAEDSIRGGGGEDAIVTMFGEKRRVPLTGVITATPNHPLLYFCAKWALKSMIWDNYLVWGESVDFRAFNSMGRNTDIAALQTGLKYVLGKEWEAKSNNIGSANLCELDETKSVRFLKASDVVFPQSLLSPMHDMVSIVKKYANKSELPGDDNVIIKSFQDIESNLEQEHKKNETYVSMPDPIMFSCVEHTLEYYTSNI